MRGSKDGTMKRVSSAVLLKRMPEKGKVRGAGAGKKKNAFSRGVGTAKKEKKTAAVRGRNPRSGTVPYLIEQDGTVRVMLVTPKGGGAWILPKGNLEKNMTPAESAAKEAFEEAGVTGICDPVVLGEYRWQSQRVRIYPLRITRILDEWEETGMRSRFLFRLEMAIRMTPGAGMKRVLRALGDYLAKQSS